MSKFSEEELELLRNCELLRDLSAHNFDTFISISHRASYEAGEEMLQEGKHSDYIFILLSGTVELYKANYHRIGTLSRGQSIGEMRIIKNQPCSLTVRTKTPTVALCILLSKLRGLEYYQCYESILDAIINILSYRLIQADQLVVTEANKNKLKRIFPGVAMATTAAIFLGEVGVALYYFFKL